MKSINSFEEPYVEENDVQQMNFSLLPQEMIEKILFLVPNLYYYLTLNLVDRHWHEIIITHISKDEIFINHFTKEKLRQDFMMKEAMVSIFRHYFNIYHHQSINIFHVMVLNQFIVDRNEIENHKNNLDVFYFKPDDTIDIKIFIKALFMIKLNLSSKIKDHLKSIKKITRKYTYVAAAFGHIEILEYLNERNVSFDVKTSANAARFNNLDCLIYLHENGYPWDEECCELASEYGHLEVLKYLHENGCPWNEKCCEIASQNGHLEVLNYLHENDCTMRGREQCWKCSTKVGPFSKCGRCKIAIYCGRECQQKDWPNHKPFCNV